MLLVYIQLRVQDLTTLYTGSGDFVNKGGNKSFKHVLAIFIFKKSF